MAAFESLAARPVQAHPLREEIRKLPTGVGFQGVRSVFIQRSIMSSKYEIFGLGAALSRFILSRRNIKRVGKKKQGF
ncbi:MAG: hypothetical protein RL739_2649 [Pseudomonadota bacterium]